MQPWENATWALFLACILWGGFMSVSQQGNKSTHCRCDWKTRHSIILFFIYLIYYFCLSKIKAFHKAKKMPELSFMYRTSFTTSLSARIQPPAHFRTKLKLLSQQEVSLFSLVPSHLLDPSLASRAGSSSATRE